MKWERNATIGIRIIIQGYWLKEQFYSLPVSVTLPDCYFRVTTARETKSHLKHKSWHKNTPVQESHAAVHVPRPLS